MMATTTHSVTIHPGATPSDPYAKQAQAATDLRYAPEFSALNLLLSQAGQQYKQGAGQASAAAKSIIAATDQAAPGLADFLARAGQRQSGVLGQVAAPTAGMQSEAALANANHGLDVQSAAAMLAKEKVRAAEAGAYQGKKLYGDYANTVGQIRQRGADLSKEAGMFAAQTYQGNVADAAKAAAAAQNAAAGRLTQRLVAGVDQNGQVIPGSPKAQQLSTAQYKATHPGTGRRGAAGNKGPSIPLSMQNTIISNVKSVAGLVKSELNKPAPADITLPDGTVLKKGQPLSSGAIRALLTTPHNPLGKAYDKDTINSAFDIAVNGGLSQPNVKALHGAGVKIKGRLPTLASRPAGSGVATALGQILGQITHG